MKSNVLLISLVAATGGLLFGFDTGVISGALPFLKQHWQLSDASLEWVTTSVLIGAVLGALTSGQLSDILGRKRMIIINAIIFGIGALGCAFAPSVTILIIMRIVIGVAIGITSYVVPMYIAEIAPARRRGALVTLNQLMITIGILVSYITDYYLSNDAVPESWRWMFLVGFFPAVILFTGMLFLPETPRWLVSKLRYDEGYRVLTQVEDADLVDQTMESLRQEVQAEAGQTTDYREVFKPGYAPR